jgi:predicted acyl esterase
LEAEEHARQNAFKNRMDQLHQFAESYEAKVGSQIKAQAASNNERILKALAEEERAAEEKERLKVEKRKEASRRDADYNLQMMEQKKLQKEREKMESLEIRLKVEREVKEAKRRDMEQEDIKKYKLLEAKKDLDRQMLVRLENKKKDKATYSVDADRENQVIFMILYLSLISKTIS